MMVVLSGGNPEKRTWKKESLLLTSCLQSFWQAYLLCSAAFLHWWLNQHLPAYNIDWRQVTLQEFFKPSTPDWLWWTIQAHELSSYSIPSLSSETASVGLPGPYWVIQSNKFSFSIATHSTSSTPLENPDQYRAIGCGYIKRPKWHSRTW